MMQPRILFAVDPGHEADPAVAHVAALARDSHDDVVVIHVHEVALGRWGRLQVCCPEDEGEKHVADIVERLNGMGVTATAESASALFGPSGVATRLVERAEQLDARLIVVCTRGRGDVASMMLGSVTHRLIHESHRPVLVIPHGVPVTPQVPAQAATSEQLDASTS